MTILQPPSRSTRKTMGAAKLVPFPRSGRSVGLNPVLVSIVGTGISVGLVGLWLQNVPFVPANAWVIIIALALGFAAVAASWLFWFVLCVQPNEKKLNQLLACDPLTDLLNRRSFETQLSLELDIARRRRTPLALLAIDIDHFRQFNDTYGRARGDKALVAVAHCIGEAVRPYECTIARFGGEEFAILMTGRSTTKATELAAAIRTMVERLQIRHCRSEFHHLTVSIGAATCAQFGKLEPADLLAAASLEMQEAKLAGRNQICASAPSKWVTS
ncbi:GGDEF domain-containing protein [Paraburkholderia terrae]